MREFLTDIQQKIEKDSSYSLSSKNQYPQQICQYHIWKYESNLESIHLFDGTLSMMSSSSSWARVVGVDSTMFHTQNLSSPIIRNETDAKLVTNRQLVTTLTDANIKTAVDLWLSDSTAATTTYGHISTWDTSAVTNMESLFYQASLFNDNVSYWNTAKVTSIHELHVLSIVSVQWRSIQVEHSSSNIHAIYVPRSCVFQRRCITWNTAQVT